MTAPTTALRREVHAFRVAFRHLRTRSLAVERETTEWSTGWIACLHELCEFILAAGPEQSDLVHAAEVPPNQKEWPF